VSNEAGSKSFILSAIISASKQTESSSNCIINRYTVRSLPSGARYYSLMYCTTY
jgi:hypothetical protein